MPAATEEAIDGEARTTTSATSTTRMMRMRKDGTVVDLVATTGDSAADPTEGTNISMIFTPKILYACAIK
jgi:hypothetical protein